MTLLTRAISYYYLCIGCDHRFQRSHRDEKTCPRCGDRVRVYGLKDSTRYAEEMEGVPGEELSESGS